MSKKSYIFLILAIIIVNAASFYYYQLIQKTAWEKEKKGIELKTSQDQKSRWQKKYNSIVRQLEEYVIKNKSLSQKIDLLQKEKQDLIQKAKRLRSSEYLADIVTDRIRLKLEVKDLEEQIKAKDTAITPLIKYKETLEALLGKEKHLSQKLARSIAEEKEKNYYLNRELSQKSSLLTKMQRQIDNLNKSQMSLNNKIKGLEEIVWKKNKEIKVLEKKINAGYGQHKVMETKLAQAKEEKQLLKEELTATKRLYEEAKANNITLSAGLLEANKKITALGEKSAKMELSFSERELENQELQERYGGLLQENKALQEKLDQKDTSFMLELSKTITLDEDAQESLPEIRGKILVISSRHNFVIINIGIEDGVQIGNTFSIYRAHRKLGEIEVTRIRSRSSFANIKSLLEGTTLTAKDTIR